jgi:DNA-binding CsgD family transcriptional regulator
VAATSPDVAADLLGRAIGLMRPADPGRDRLLAEQAGSLMWAGGIPHAQAICRALLCRDHDPGAEGPARICLGYALIAEGHGRDGLRELERAGESPVLSDAERAGARAWGSLARLSLGDLDGASTAAKQARPAAVSAGNHQATSVAMASLALISEHRGHLTHAIEVIDDAVRLADRSPGRQGHRYPVHIDRAFILVGLDRLDEARSTLGTGRRISEELGVLWPLPTYHVALAVERFIAGEWDDAIAEVEASLDLADETGHSYRLMIGSSVMSLISLHRNDLNRAEEEAASAVARAAETRSRGRAWATWAHALVLEANGKISDALAALAECGDQCARLGLALAIPVFGADLVRLAAAAGDTEHARHVSSAVANVAARGNVPSLTGAALRCRGLVEHDAASLLAAAAAYARGSRPLEQALACEDAGTAFARQGMAGQARRPLEQALEIYERLGASRDLARAEAVLREAGVRRGRRGTRSRPQAGWQSLTPSERTVANLVAQGLSNPQIGDRLYISRRTVQTHLAHVFAKLDITSRAQLAAEVTRHQSSRPEAGTGTAGA